MRVSKRAKTPERGPNTIVVGDRVRVALVEDRVPRFYAEDPTPRVFENEEWIVARVVLGPMGIPWSLLEHTTRRCLRHGQWGPVEVRAILYQGQVEVLEQAHA